MILFGCTPRSTAGGHGPSSASGAGATSVSASSGHHRHDEQRESHTSGDAHPRADDAVQLLPVPERRYLGCKLTSAALAGRGSNRAAGTTDRSSMFAEACLV